LAGVNEDGDLLWRRALEATTPFALFLAAKASRAE